MNPKVSIIIPYYNNENHITETLESVFGQTYADKEIIVVNDGSTPASAEFLEGLKVRFEGLIVIHKKNEGQSIARNTGAAAAAGGYLLFVDGDDKIDKTYIQKAMQILEADPKMGIVYSKGQNFGVRNDEWVLPPYKLKRILFENCIPITALIYRTDFESTGGFDSSLEFFEDWDLWLAIIQKGKDVHRIEEKLFYYRRREESNSLSDYIRHDKEKISDNFYKVYQKHYNFYKQNDIYFIDFFKATSESFRYRKKYYDVWYRKLFYGIKHSFVKEKERDISGFQKAMEELNF